MSPSAAAAVATLAVASSRQRALSLYRQILRLARQWPSRAGTANPVVEAAYIRSEASSLFRQHQAESDPAAIEAYIMEAESRVSLTLHYNTPYPRMTNLPPRSLVSPGKPKKRTAKGMDEALPAYMKSYSGYSPKTDK